MYYCILDVRGRLLSMKEAWESLEVFVTCKFQQTTKCPSRTNEALLKAKAPSCALSIVCMHLSFSKNLHQTFFWLDQLFSFPDKNVASWLTSAHFLFTFPPICLSTFVNPEYNRVQIDVCLSDKQIADAWVTNHCTLKISNTITFFPCLL